jgi:hypothetical protein
MPDRLSGTVVPRRHCHAVSISTNEGTQDMFRAYSGPRGAQMPSPLEKTKMLYKEFSSLDDAMAWARHVNASGRVALLIESDDGTCLNKEDIVRALRHSEAFDRSERTSAA